MKRLIIGGLAAALALLITGCGGGGSTSAGKPGPTVTVTKTVTAEPDPAEEPTEEEPADEAYTPTAADFKIRLKTREKTCFGSAGCNITFQIDPKYVGRVGGLSDDMTYDVTYKIIGGDSGPQVNTFTIEAGEASFDQEEFISTKSASTQLRAVVVSVDAY